MIQNTLYKGVKLARGLGMYPKRKWILIYACCLPLATLDLKRVSPLLTGAVRHFLPIHIRTHSIWGRKEQKKPSFSPGKRKKVFTHSHTIFPFTHRPVQVVCSPQSIIFTVVTDGRKAYCNYSYRYWGHLEVVSPHWKTELLELSKYSQKAVVNTQGGCKEATKWHICIVEKKERARESKWEKYHNNPALGLNPCSDCSLPPLPVWCAVLFQKLLPHGGGHQESYEGPHSPQVLWLMSEPGMLMDVHT